MSLSEDTPKVQTKIDYNRKWYVMAAVAMGIFLATIDSSIVNIALPTLVRELNTDFATIQWVVLVYLLTFATLILSFGRLGDMVGKKPVYATGFVVFTLGLILCGLLATVSWLIFFRVVQAIGATMVLALGMGVFSSPNNSTIMGTAPRERLGIVSGILAVNRTLGQMTGIAVLGAIWTSRVIAYSGSSVEGGATNAELVNQVSGLHDTFFKAVVVILAALSLSVWSYIQDRREKKSQVLKPTRE